MLISKLATGLGLMGGIVLFFFGGLNLGGGEYVQAEPSLVNKIGKAIGLLLVIFGAVIQFLLVD